MNHDWTVRMVHACIRNRTDMDIRHPAMTMGTDDQEFGAVGRHGQRQTWSFLNQAFLHSDSGHFFTCPGYRRPEHFRGVSRVVVFFIGGS